MSAMSRPAKSVSDAVGIAYTPDCVRLCCRFEQRFHPVCWEPERERAPFESSCSKPWNPQNSALSASTADLHMAQVTVEALEADAYTVCGVAYCDSNDSPPAR
jgi:hypothetical protein